MSVGSCGAALGHHLASQMAKLGVSKAQNVAVALSGGADSLSLALAVSVWKGLRGQCITSLQLHFLLTSNTLPSITFVSAARTPSGVATGHHDIPETSSRSVSHYLTAAQHLQCLLRPSWLPTDRLLSQAVQQDKAFAFCIDHKLRPESKVEAARAAAQAAALGLDPVQLALEWTSLPSKGNLMEAASAARYSALRQLCRKHSAIILLTGHHAGTCHMPVCALLHLSKVSLTTNHSMPLMLKECAGSMCQLPSLA